MSHQVDERTIEIIKLLSENESAMARLYGLYSTHLSNKDFWRDMEKQERVHEQWLRALLSSSLDDNEEVYFDPDHFNEIAIKSAINYVSNMINKEATNHNVLAALSISLSIEQSLIEKEYLSPFSANSPSVNHILSYLQEETKIHIGLIQDEI